MYKIISKISVLVLSSLFIVSISKCSAQDNKDNIERKGFSRTQLVEDFEVLKSELKLNHPGLYNYTNQLDIEEAFSKIETSFTSNETVIDFYRKIAILNSIIKDAHTKIIIPESFDIARNNELPRLPFAIHFEKTKMFVLRNLSENLDIKTGWEILSINGIEINSLVSDILKVISRDGNNLSSPLYLLNKDFGGYYAEVFGCPDKFDIEFVNASNEKVLISLNALKTNQIISNLKSRYPNKKDKNQELIEFKMYEKIGVLTVKSFDGEVIKKHKINYKKKFKSIFKNIREKSINNLVIDIRNNPGGWPEVADELLSYLIQGSFIHYKYEASLVKEIVNKQRYLSDGTIEHFEGRNFHNKQGDYYHLNPKEKRITPKNNVYRNNIIVLINEATASQAAEFSGLLKDKTKALFVGQETRGNPNLLCGGNISTLILPNTRIKVHIPLIKAEVNISFNSKKKGLVPDYFVKLSINDRLNKKDAILFFAFKKLKKQ